MHESYEEFASGLRDLRLAKRWSQEDLARRVGVTGATISRWENAKDFPTSQHLRDLAEVFKLPVDTFVRRWRGAIQDAKFAARVREARQGGDNHDGDVRESYVIGKHKVELLKDGALRVRGVVIPAKD